MANINTTWQVQGIISAEESVLKMLAVIQSKGLQHSGTFWTYENRVSLVHFLEFHPLTRNLALCLVTIYFRLR
jgi:hypothetical protein